MSATVPGPDGQPRCHWCAATPDYVAYHDTEWGFPVDDDRRLFEKLCLEGFQSGLSWRTILAKRENFRRAFAGFEIAAVARRHGIPAGPRLVFAGNGSAYQNLPVLWAAFRRVLPRRHRRPPPRRRRSRRSGRRIAHRPRRPFRTGVGSQLGSGRLRRRPAGSPRRRCAPPRPTTAPAQPHERCRPRPEAPTGRVPATTWRACRSTSSCRRRSRRQA